MQDFTSATLTNGRVTLHGDLGHDWSVASLWLRRWLRVDRAGLEPFRTFKSDSAGSDARMPPGADAMSRFTGERRPG